MKVLIGMERHGRTRDAFLALGHDAISCDILPATAPGPHYQGDVWEIVEEGWDLAIFHPTCTFLTNSAEWAYGDGPYHQKVKPDTPVGAERRALRESAIAEVERIADLHKRGVVKRLCIENPVGVLSARFRKPDQIIQPYEFGDDASKATCLWLYDLPPLEPTEYFQPRMLVWEQGKRKVLKRWGNQTESGQSNVTPSDDRWDIRSETFPGIADAFASQWGSL